MKITIKEIAEIAGVHRSTVDKVIHNRVGVSDEVREKIQKIIDESGYEPNLFGRALQKQQKTTVIAAILAEVDALPYIKDGMQRALEEFGSYNLELQYHITSMQNSINQADIIRKCIQDKVDGIILLPIHTREVKELINKAAEEGIPVVTVNSDIDGSHRLCFIGQNEWKAGRVGARLLGEFLGKKGKVGIVTNSKNYSVMRRCRGFVQLLKEDYPEIQTVMAFDTNEDPEYTYQGALKMFDEYPDVNGLFLTCGCVKDVCLAGIKKDRIKDIKVVCFEDYDEIVQLIQNNVIVSTITASLQNQGYDSVKVLNNLLIFGRDPEQEFIETEIKIVVKENV